MMINSRKSCSAHGTKLDAWHVKTCNLQCIRLCLQTGLFKVDKIHPTNSYYIKLVVIL